MMHYGYYDGGAHPLVWGVLFIVALVLAAAAVWVVVSFVHQRGAPVQSVPEARGAEALRILDERFARGEIDEDEYSKRRDLLRS